MANPNIVAVSTINGISAGIPLTTSATTVLVNNPNGSGKVLKLNTLIISNKDSSNASSVSVVFHPNGAGATGASNVFLLDTIPVPVAAGIVVVDKSSSIYILENMSVSAQANIGGSIDVTVSYEEIS